MIGSTQGYRIHQNFIHLFTNKANGKSNRRKLIRMRHGTVEWKRQRLFLTCWYGIRLCCCCHSMRALDSYSMLFFMIFSLCACAVRACLCTPGHRVQQFERELDIDTKYFVCASYSRRNKCVRWCQNCTQCLALCIVPPPSPCQYHWCLGCAWMKSINDHVTCILKYYNVVCVPPRCSLDCHFSLAQSCSVKVVVIRRLSTFEKMRCWTTTTTTKLYMLITNMEVFFLLSLFSAARVRACQWTYYSFVI